MNTVPDWKPLSVDEIEVELYSNSLELFMLLIWKRFTHEIVWRGINVSKQDFKQSDAYLPMVSKGLKTFNKLLSENHTIFFTRANNE